MNARDTHPDAAAVQAAVLRRMTPGQRVELGIQMSEDAREVVLAGIRSRHPEYDETQARYALFRLLLGDELFARAWPHAPLLAP
ncbi:MAG TPA: hypothetical protein VIV11_14870 [Kofleriaceae bacterium]